MGDVWIELENGNQFPKAPRTDPGAMHAGHAAALDLM
jgi:hypothetical protein